jgi:hypothetical protein
MMTAFFSFLGISSLDCQINFEHSSVILIFDLLVYFFTVP